MCHSILPIIVIGLLKMLGRGREGGKEAVTDGFHDVV
jgi:hypothetical protein